MKQPKKPKDATRAKRPSQFESDLIEAAESILAHVRGEKTFPTRRFVLPGPVDVKQIRESANMSQLEFAQAFCINPRTLQDWEQGRRKPDTTTRAYLSVIAQDRQAVLKALGTQSR